MKIAVGSDHRGLEFKKQVIDMLKGKGYDVQDFGTFSEAAVDYPDIAAAVSRVVADLQFNYGILICGTGNGMCIAANKVKGIRAVICWDTFGAQRARQHNNANVICLGAERGISGMEDVLQTFLTTQFEGGRHQRRLDKIRDLELS